MAMTRDLNTEVDALIAGALSLNDRYRVYDRLREEAPVYQASGRVLVSRWSDVSAGFRDERLASGTAGGHGSYERQVLMSAGATHRQQLLRVLEHNSRKLTALNGQQHDRLRELVHRFFTPRAVRKLETRIQQLCDELLDRAAPNGRMEIISEFAYQLPLAIMTEMFDIPSEDSSDIHDWTSQIAIVEPTSPDAVASAFRSVELFESYIRRSIANRRGGNTTEILDGLIAAAHAGHEWFTEDDLVVTIAMFLLGGHETTTNLIANAAHALLTHGAQWNILRDDPDLVPSAIEEVLRWNPPLQEMQRTANVDMEISGIAVKRFDTVSLVMASANRDAERFDNADRLDVKRQDVRHLGFGLGEHFCLGAALARMETTAAFRTLLRRFPDMSFERDEFSWHPGLHWSALKAVPVKLGRERT
jgi:cytochrome P450